MPTKVCLVKTMVFPVVMYGYESWTIKKVKSLSCVQLFATPWTVAYHAPMSMGFCRQEYWSGLPFPSPCMKVKSESEVSQSCPTLRDSMNCSLPGSSIHGIFQARVLEWVAIAFSETNSQSLPKLMSIESVMPSNYLILCRPLLLLPSLFPSLRVFSNESALHIR